MSLSPKEKQIVQFGKEQGKSQVEIMQAVSRFRNSSQEQGSVFSRIVKDIPSDIGDIGRGIAEDFRGTVEDIGPEIARGASEQTTVGEDIQTGFRLGGAVGSTIGSIVGRVGQGAAKLFTTPETEEAISGGVQRGARAVAETELGQNTINALQEFEQNNPDAAKNIKAALGIAEGIGSVVGVGQGLRTTRNIARAGFNKTEEILSGIQLKSAGLFDRDRSFNSVDDLLEETAEKIDTSTTAGLRKQAEAEGVEVGVRAKIAGLTPAAKKRLQDNPEVLKDYLNISHARKNGSTITEIGPDGRPIEKLVPTPLGAGGDKAEDVAGQMQKLINDTGSEIGATRRRYATIQANRGQIETIENTFINELSKRGLRINNGQVERVPGKIAKIGSDRDISVLNELYQEMKIAKQSPTLENLIDLRMAFDSKVKFAKSAQEVSDEVDLISRVTRKDIANQAAEIVGPSEARKLEEYSRFMDAYGELKSYTDRRAGGEYLVRLVLSGRGDDARKTALTIKQFTGVDLMDDAEAITLATDLVGDPTQKTLFAQEVSKAGLDAARAAKGDVGAIAQIIQRIIFSAKRNEAAVLREIGAN